jgi:hypothetical protein
MLTYSQIEQALLNLNYIVDFDLRHHAKLNAFISVNGYKSDIVLEFREGYKSELGDCNQLLQLEWLMADDASVLVLDLDSLDDVDDIPSIFLSEKLILREIFDRIIEEIKKSLSI